MRTIRGRRCWPMRAEPSFSPSVFYFSAMLPQRKAHARVKLGLQLTCSTTQGITRMRRGGLPQPLHPAELSNML
eukprot:3677037-Amphidinium_carterae.1